MKHITTNHFGDMENGEPVYQYTLTNGSGMQVSLISLGATLTEIIVPDRSGNMSNVVLGFHTLYEYLKAQDLYFGCVIGRIANRVANSSAQINGKNWKLSQNHGKHHIHGGRKGFHTRIWDVDIMDDQDDTCGLTLRYTSPHLEEGYPGNLTVQSTINLTNENSLVISYRAETDQATPVNLTNHSYFNLTGKGQTSCLDHILTIHADRFTEADTDLIPTGSTPPVNDLTVDFRRPERVGDRITNGEYPMEHTGGYDHNYIINKNNAGLNTAAELYDPESGRVMQVSTTQPCIQLYTGNHVPENLKGRHGKMGPNPGICLETQGYPDALNHKQFDSILLLPATRYRETTEYRFSTRT